MFDLNEMDTKEKANEGVEIEILHTASGKDTGVRIRVHGQDSDAYIKAQRAVDKRRQDKIGRGGFRGPVLPTAEEVEADGYRLLAAATISWRTVDGDAEKPTVTVSGVELECNEANAIKVYSRYPDVREQVSRAIQDRALFING